MASVLLRRPLLGGLQTLSEGGLEAESPKLVDAESPKLVDAFLTLVLALGHLAVLQILNSLPSLLITNTFVKDQNIKQ